MRIGDLAKTTGVPVATLKFYLREGLLPAGTPTAVNQAEYDDVHVRRVKLVRALLHLGGLSIADAQRVLAAVDDETMPIHGAFGVAQGAMVPKLDRSGTLRRCACRGRPLRAQASTAGAAGCRRTGNARRCCGGVGRVRSAGRARHRHLRVVRRNGAGDGGAGRAGSCHHPHPALRAQQVEHTVVGTVVFEVAYAALRRMALEHASAQRWSAP